VVSSDLGIAGEAFSSERRPPAINRRNEVKAVERQPLEDPLCGAAGEQ
jgi:hypothetical protein